MMIFGRLHENVRITLASMDSHYDPLSAKRRKALRRLFIKSIKKAAASGELKRIMETGDIIQGFRKPEEK